MLMRVGQGFDVHPLVIGRPLIIGGVRIPHTKGLLGHSDADVLAHAACDALLGAAGLGDLGRHFPDDEARYKDICSLELLDDVRKRLHADGWRIINLDATVIADAPKLAPFIPDMVGNLARSLHLASEGVNVKATTCEGLGFVGRKDGIAAMSVALIGKD